MRNYLWAVCIHMNVRVMDKYRVVLAWIEMYSKRITFHKVNLNFISAEKSKMSSTYIVSIETSVLAHGPIQSFMISWAWKSRQRNFLVNCATH